MRNSIRTRLAVAFIALAASLLVLVGAILAWQSYISERDQAIVQQGERSQRISIQVASYMQIQENALTELIDVRGFGNLSQDQQSQILSEMIAYSDAFETLSLVGSNGREKVSVASTEVNRQLRDLSAADEFTIPVSNQQVYYSPVQFSERTGEPYMVISAPIINVRTGIVTDVLVAEIRFKPIWDLLASSVVRGRESSTYIVDAQNRVVAHDNPSIVLRNTLFTVPSDGVHVGVNGTNVVLATDKIKLGTQEFSVITETPTSEAFANIVRTELTIAGLLLLAIVIAGGIGWFAAGQIVQPIESLVKSAQAISAGDLSKHVEVTRRDEIGNLGEAFNSMTTQLRDLIGNLEQRVADRTKALATSAEVSRRLSTILEKDQLVHEVVNQVKTSFNYYHAHIYLLDEAGTELIMAGGTGEVGQIMLERGHKISKGKGLVGRAAETNAPVVVSETASDPNWLPNPLLPDTKSEIAVPISIGNQVLGVLDAQHNIAGGLQQQDADLLASIANQVAVALLNIQQYEKTQKIAADMGVVADVGIATSTITEVGKLLQEVVNLSKKSFNLYHAHIYLMNETEDTLVLASGAGEVGRQMVAEKRTIPLNSEKSLVARAARTREGVVVNDVAAAPDFLPHPLLPNTRSEMAVPMMVGGKVIGVMDVQSETVNRFTDVDVSIQTTLASQVAIALQNARTLTQTQQQADRELMLNTIGQKIQSATTVEAVLQIAARELGRALGAPLTIAQLGLQSSNGSDNGQ